MAPLPDSLGEDERLLLHLANETPEPGAPDGASNGASTGHGLVAAFAALDGRLTADARSLKLPASGPAVRGVLEAMRAFEKPPAPARRWRIPRPPVWSLYPAAAAALLVLAMAGWWYKVHDDLSGPAPNQLVFEPSRTELVFRGDANQPLESLSDEQIQAQFSSMIFEPRLGFEPQLQALDYLESVTQ